MRCPAVLFGLLFAPLVACSGELGTLVSDAGLPTDVTPDPDAWPAPDTVPDTIVSPDAFVPLDTVAPPQDARPGCIRGSLLAYTGDVHAHTGYSDGADASTPAQAFAHAKATGNLDILFITDHRSKLTTTEWNNCRSQADKANVTGSFVADCGYELQVLAETTSAPGNRSHANVLFPGSYLAPTAASDSLSAFFTAISGCSACMGQFNHPNSVVKSTDKTTYMSWYDLKLRQAAEPKMGLFEFNSGNIEAFLKALTAGWHLSPSCNSDTHSANWGDSARATGFWLDELSRASVKRAVQERRTFSTRDKTATIKLLADGRCWMGSRLGGGGPLPLLAEVTRTDGFTGELVLLGPGQSVFAARSCTTATLCSLQATLNTPLPRFVFAAALKAGTSTDSPLVSGDVLVSAPLWLEP